MAQLVRAPPCHGGGRGFDSHSGRFRQQIEMSAVYIADMAQLAEQLICNQQVIGSSPIIGSQDVTGWQVDDKSGSVLWGNSRVAKGGRL